MQRLQAVRPVLVSPPAETRADPGARRARGEKRALDKAYIMKKILMPHQREALRYARGVQHPFLAMEMRLGKTLTTIRRLLMYAPLRPSTGARLLIIAPNSALGSWERELAGEGETDVVFLQGTRAERLELLSIGTKWMLTNKEAWRSIPEIADYAWDAVVLDESTFCKNPKAQVTRFFLKNFRDVPHRWALTGLPAPEGPLDLWCQISWLNGRAFGCESYWQFRARHFETDYAGFDWVPKPGANQMIEAELASKAFCLRRQDAGMVTPKVHERREVELPPKMREAYEKAEELFVLEYDGREVSRTVWATQRWHWMRQLCGGFIDRRLYWSGKIDELVSLVTGELAAEQVVIWFSYNPELRACLEALRKKRVRCEVMLGDVKPERRRELERHFRRGWFRVFLIQEAVAETGLDLSTADTAIYFSNHPGLEKRAQSEDRLIHPLKKSPCLYIDLVVKDSVEEVVSEKLGVKKWRSQRTFDRAVVAGIKARRSA